MNWQRLLIALAFAIAALVFSLNVGASSLRAIVCFALWGNLAWWGLFIMGNDEQARLRREIDRLLRASEDGD
jgi:hypothetical protein